MHNEVGSEGDTCRSHALESLYSWRFCIGTDQRTRLSVPYCDFRKFDYLEKKIKIIQTRINRGTSVIQEEISRSSRKQRFVHKLLFQFISL